MAKQEKHHSVPKNEPGGFINAQGESWQTQNEKLLKIAELEHLYNNRMFGLAFFDTELRYQRINQCLANMNGIPVDEHIGRTLSEVKGSLFSKIEPHCLEVLATKQDKVDNFNRELPETPGVFHELQLTFSAIKSAQGKLEGISVFIQDISENKQVDQLIPTSQERFKILFESAPIAHYSVGDDGYILIANKAAGKLFGYPAAQLLGKAVFSLLAPTSQGIEKAKLIFQRFKSGENINNEEVEILQPDGSHCWMSLTVRPLIDRNNKVIASQSMAIDITERKAAEDELHQYREDLEKLVAERTEKLKLTQEELLRKERLAALGQVTASVSHELRNPLGTIYTSIYTIDRKVQGKKLGMDRVLNRIKRNIVRCNNIIQGLLDYTRIKTLQFKPVSFDLWLTEMLEEYELPEEIKLEKNLSFGQLIVLDSESFRRVIINILDNACQAIAVEKKTDTQSLIRVSTEFIKDRLEIRIKDDGVGISSEDLTIIFEPLFSNKSFGVGLGLTMVKQIMQQHHGDIDVNSEKGTGTEILLWLPVHVDNEMKA